MSTPKCDKCNRTVVDVVLHRANPKGETPAIWECDGCSTGEISKSRKQLCALLSPETSFNFSSLKEVPEDSIEAKLFRILDDIDTGLDMLKPDIQDYEKYVMLRLRIAQTLIVSDGYKLYYTGL